MRSFSFAQPMRFLDTIRNPVIACLVAMACALSCFARRASFDVPQLGNAPDTESVTNVVFNAGGEDARLFRLVVELRAADSNSVDVALGRDMDENGVLARHETDAVIGWDSGEWFYRDRRSRVEMRKARPPGLRKLDWRLSLGEDLRATSLVATDGDGIVFSGAVPLTMFSTEWNMMRIVSRGLAEPDGTASCRVSARGIMVFMR